MIEEKTKHFWLKLKSLALHFVEKISAFYQIKYKFIFSE